MTLEIKPLSQALAADYFEFFELRAFTDGSPYRCYCQMFQTSKQQEIEQYAHVAPEDMGRAARASAEAQIASGALRGYIAYVDGVSMGWANVNDRANYPADSTHGARYHLPTPNISKAAACFEIAPECRGKGVATALLRRAIADARAEGYKYIDGFPIPRDERYEWDYAGPVRLFENEGFSLIETHADYAVMRKQL